MTAAKWDSNKSPICPRRNAIEETFYHVFQCKSKHADLTHREATKKLKEGLRKAKTTSIIQRTIVQNKVKHRKGHDTLMFTDIIVSSDQKKLAVKVFQNQEKLGPTALVQGYLSKDWAVLQNVYDGEKDITDVQTDWMTRITKHIWAYSISMWKACREQVHGPGENKTGSKRRKELIKLIDEELERTRYFGDFEIRQLRRNMTKSKGNANTAVLETWLGMIRNMKESVVMLKRETRLTKTRMQSITRFLCRRAPA